VTYLRINDVSKLLVLVATLTFIGGFFLGRNSVPEAHEYEKRISGLKNDISYLEEHIVECWNDLPLTHIRKGNIAY